MSKILPAARCSQMSNPKAGTGQGGDRCVEATAAMIDATYKIGPKAQAGADPEALMYAFTEEWNSGSDVSSLESAQRIIDFVNESGKVSISEVSGTFANAQTVIDRGHIAYTGVNDYRQLRLVDGSNPYQWNPATQPGPAGHVLLIVGYGAGVIVHDPLRSEFDGQPAEYSVTSFEAAGWSTIGEVVGPRLDAAPEPGSVARTHVIGPGETFWSLADYFYGDPTLYPILQAANPEMHPTALQIGATIIVPPKPASTTPAQGPAAPPEPQTHVIVAGDTFWGIAERYYGSGALYTVLEQANPGMNPAALQIGATMTIPPKP